MSSMPRFELLVQAMKNVDADDRLKILHLHNDQLNFIRQTRDRIANIRVGTHGPYSVSKRDKNNIISYYINHLPDTDRHLRWDSKSSFMWFINVKSLYENCDHFWLDADGEIYSSYEGASNMWLDDLGFLVSYHTDKFGEYADKFAMRINCLYNDVNYELLKMERDRKLYDDKLRSLGVDLSKLDLC